MGAILSFLGGSAFRMLFGEISSWVNKRQDHKFEQQRMLLQGKLDGEQHSRNLESLRVQAELGVKTIMVQADADERRVEAEAFKEAMIASRVPTGIAWVDAWNGIIRPAFGTAALALWLLAEHRTGWAFSAWSMDLAAVVIGYFFADRSLRRRGK